MNSKLVIDPSGLTGFVHELLREMREAAPDDESHARFVEHVWPFVREQFRRDGVVFSEVIGQHLHVGISQEFRAELMSKVCEFHQVRLN